MEVVDGDTLVVQHGVTQKKIRLFGIDCPESNQPFGKEAREFTAQLALSQTVRIEPLDTDTHGRIVAKVYLSDGIYLNAQIVSAGYAWWFRKYAPRENILRKTEQEARSARRGLWKSTDQQEPWSFRQHQHGTQQNLETNSTIQITYLHCNGTGETEPDEFVEIKNITSETIDMTGWSLHDEGGKHTFRFPAGFRFAAAEKCKIYTNFTTGCLTFGEDKSAVWNNKRDRAYLLDSSGKVVATRMCDN